eukprot:607083-Pleurochrysis_carterae.AAC.2
MHCHSSRYISDICDDVRDTEMLSKPERGPTRVRVSTTTVTRRRRWPSPKRSPVSRPCVCERRSAKRIIKKPTIQDTVAIKKQQLVSQCKWVFSAGTSITIHVAVPSTRYMGFEG